jgi:DNA modification methylase
LWDNKIVGHADIDPESLLAHPGNFRIHPSNQQKALEGSIGKLGFIRSVTVSQRTGTVIDGHLRVILALRNQEPTIPVEYVYLTEQEENEALLLLDPISAMAVTDKEKMEELFALVMGDDDMDEMLRAISDNEQVMQAPEAPADPLYKTLAERFGVPPFSVLDARQGYWQERKRAWISLGIRGELGRGGSIHEVGDSVNGSDNGNLTFATGAPRKDEVSGKNLSAGRKSGITYGSGAPGDLAQSMKSKPAGIIGGSPMPLDRQKNYVNGVLMKSDSGNDPAYYFKKQAKEKELGRELTTEEFQENYYEGPDSYTAGTSIFDPVLCELVYRWFLPANGEVLDPFAGESTKGIVATYLGYGYTGVELRQEQVDENYKQSSIIGVNPTWICHDSEKLEEALPDGKKYDLVFTSPPYYDLEIYSESEKDGSAFETYEKFIAWYEEIFRQAVDRMADNRFLVVKIGEVRNKKTGAYHNFLGDNISIFKRLGLHYYNEMVLVTAVGSLPIRVGRQFSIGRKIGKTHQNILVFYKGSMPAIKSEFPNEIEMGMPEAINDED